MANTNKNENSPSAPVAREVVETLHFAWWAVSDEDSPSLCTCGHLHFLRQCYVQNSVSWRFCEDPDCRCTCLRRATENEHERPVDE